MFKRLDFNIKKIRLLDCIWLIYLSLMMSYVYTGSQQIYTGILFFLTIVHMIFTKNFKVKIKQYKGFLWYILFSIFVQLSTIWSVYNYNYTGITGWVIYISIALFCLDYAFDYRNNTLKFFQLLVLAGFIFSIVALTTSPISSYTTDTFSGITGHYRTWIGEISALLMCINICLYRYYIHEKKYLIFALLNILTVLATGARGSMLLIVLAIIWFIVKERNMNKKLLYVFGGIVVSMIVLAIIFRNNALYNAFVKRVLGAINNDGSTNSVNERLFFIQTAFELFKKNPVIGCGVDTMRGYLTSVGYWNVTYSHCVYVELLSSYGILGTILFFFPSFKKMFSRKIMKLVIMVLPIMLLGFFWSVEYYSFIFIFLIERLQFSLEESI